jgi:hypothetical protein
MSTKLTAKQHVGSDQKQPHGVHGQRAEALINTPCMQPLLSQQGIWSNITAGANILLLQECAAPSQDSAAAAADTYTPQMCCHSVLLSSCRRLTHSWLLFWLRTQASLLKHCLCERCWLHIACHRESVRTGLGEQAHTLVMHHKTCMVVQVTSERWRYGSLAPKCRFMTNIT